MILEFLGAAREVTGSCIIITSGKNRILLDCGFFQGSKFAEERNYSPFAFEAMEISTVVLCHAHLDHVGRVPLLYKRGFRGKIISTAPTKELTYLVLEDTLKLMEEEAKRNNHKSLFEAVDIEGSMELFETLDYGERLEIGNDIELTLKNSGHILGSAVALLEIEGKKLVYTSDFGNIPSQLLKPPDVVESADFIICESTYGGRVHEDKSTRFAKLSAVIEQTIKNNGVLMIPTFAIERTQELLHDIEHFCERENCALPTFFLDSPLAQKVTAVFEKYPEYLNANLVNAHKDKDFFGLKRVHITATARQSQSIADSPNPKIIIAGSGMLNGGRILHHLQDYIEDPSSSLLIVGYQAAGTLGRRILDGAKQINVYGRKFEVRAKVMAIGSYSAHADGLQLLEWLKNISGVSEIFLVHGELEQAELFASNLRKNLKVKVYIPQFAEEVQL